MVTAPAIYPEDDRPGGDAWPRRMPLGAAYLPKRYVVNCESMRVSWPAMNVFMQESSV